MTKKLNMDTIRLLICNGLNLGAKTVFRVFLNIYLWKETNDIQLLAMFNLLYLGGHITSFSSLSNAVKLGYGKLIYFLSFVGFILGYLFLIFLGEQVINYIYLVGFILGIFNGTFFINYNVTQFRLTTFKNRGNFEGIKKSLRAITQIVFPALFGLIIGLYDINLAFIVGIFLFIIAFFIGNINFGGSEGSTNYKKFIKLVLGNKKILFSFIASFFFTFAFSNFLLELIIPLLIFNEVGTEVKLGFSLSLLSIISIIIIYILGRFVDYKHYNKSFIGLNIIYVIGLTGLIYSKNYSVILFLSSLITALIALCSVLATVIINNSVHTIRDYNKYIVEFTVLREIGFIGGWILSFGLVYFSGNLSHSSMKIIFYTMIVASIITTMFLTKINIHEIEEGNNI